MLSHQMDSICSRRGSHGTNDWRDTVVNQLLSKIDGVEALNNILLIGTSQQQLGVRAQRQLRGGDEVM